MTVSGLTMPGAARHSWRRRSRPRCRAVTRPRQVQTFVVKTSGPAITPQSIRPQKRLYNRAGNDFERVAELARRMVCEWGMSEAVRPLTFGKKEEQIFLARKKGPAVSSRTFMVFPAHPTSGLNPA